MILLHQKHIDIRDPNFEKRRWIILGIEVSQVVSPFEINSIFTQRLEHIVRLNSEESHNLHEKVTQSVVEFLFQTTYK